MADLAKAGKGTVQSAESAPLSPRDAARRLAEQGAKGFAARSVTAAAAAAASAEAGRMDPGRLALQRVPSRKAAGKAPVDSAGRHSERATQALLGLLGEAAAGDDGLAERVRQLTPDERQRLAKLVAAAHPSQDERPPLLDKVDQQLADRGVKLLVKAGTVTINIGTETSPYRGPASGPRRPYVPYNRWARRLLRLRDFIMGH